MIGKCVFSLDKLEYNKFNDIEENETIQQDFYTKKKKLERCQ